jgi:positive regulator of sigma E activity
VKKNKKEKKSFSKVLLIQESILIWIITLTFLFLAFICVMNGYLGELPWITAMVSFPWAAYGVSQACYYRKSEKENTQGGITYHMALRDSCADEEGVEEENEDFTCE